MRTLILKDKDIPQDEYEELIDDIKTFYSDKFNTIKRLLKYEEEGRDFSNLEFQAYHKGLGIDKSIIVNDLKTKPRYKYDNVVYLVHEDNWKPTDIWGWNLAMSYYSFEVQQVRWDKNNLNNTFGTLNHEHWHSFDSLIYRKLNTKIENKFGVNDWDNDVVHGNGDQFSYMRYKDNESIMKDLEKELEDVWALSRVQYQSEQDSDNVELAKDLANLVNMKTSKYQKAMESMRGYIYGMTHKDVPTLKSDIIN